MKSLTKTLKLIKNNKNSKENGPSLYNIAKFANREILLESLLQSKGTYQSSFLENYKKTERSFKLKIFTTKILYSIIFGLLPLLLITTYLEIIEGLDLYPFSTENVILSGILFFSLYFMLQFFNFFLMGLLESSMVMSGLIFNWFETLPISRKRLKRLAYLTIFRTFDIPIIFIIFGFPITILMQTQNLAFFFLSLGISLINIIFSFDLLIISGKRLNGVLNASPKKALRIRLLNILSYIVVILGSIYSIQWVLTSLEDIFISMLLFEHATITNIILSSIPYPFNPSYLLYFIITPSEQISFNLLISSSVGFGLFILITYLIHRKTLIVLSQITTKNPINIQKINLKAEKEKEKTKTPIKIKTHRPIFAFLRNDLSIASHDIKVFLSLIMPIIISCIFTFSFNSGNINNSILIERDLMLFSIGILLFCPVISGMLVYAITSIDLSGETVLAALPIYIRERANAKLVIMLTLQILALFTPLLLFILSPKFSIFFLATLISMPFVLIFLIFTFELKIFYFNKFKNRYVIGEVYQEKKLFKWTLIISIQFILIFWMLSFILIFFIFQLWTMISIFYSIATLVCIIFGGLVYSKMFPLKEEKKLKFMNEPRQTKLMRHSWLSLILILILWYINLNLSDYIADFFLNNTINVDPYYYRLEGYNIMILSGVILFNLSFVPLFFIIFPIVLGLPNGKQPINLYLAKIKAPWLRPIKKKLLAVSIVMIIIFVISPLLYNLISIEYEFISILFDITYIFWQEILFRGIILTMFLRTKKKSSAIIINAFVILLIPFSYFSFLSFNLTHLPMLLVYLLPTFLVQVIIAFICFKTNSIIPGIIAQIFIRYMYFGGVPILYIPLFFLLNNNFY